MISPVVIDANLAVYSVLNTPHTALAAKTMNFVVSRGSLAYAPGLWWFEITSVIHRYRFAGLINDTAAYSALDLLTNGLDIQRIDVPLRNAFDWATRLRQKPAYDGFYLAAAEQINAELWTADQALVNNSRQTGINWVHWMGEAE